MADNYRLFAGLIIFLVVVIGTLSLAASSYPEVAPGGSMPGAGPGPRTPGTGGAGTDIITFIYSNMLFGIQSFISAAVSIFAFIGNVLTFNIPALNSMGTVGLMIRLSLIVPTWFVIFLFFARFLRSILPFVSGAE